MEFPKDTQWMEIVTAPKSYQDLLDAQKDLFQNQIEKLQQVVATQCTLTGVNPLSQEMAAGALSIKIGKRPRDLLNPKAVKYMQLVFSIKDVITKRETREISAQFGVTITQVRDFFTGQRSRVRKFVRLSREKADRSTACDGMSDEIGSTSGPNMPVEPVPLNTMAPVNSDEGPVCSKRDEVLSGVEESERHFIENIFTFMRKEESFSGQVKLLRWILHIKNPSALNWFLTEGGLMILATWLSEAAKEEQTNFLHVMLKVLDYLPLPKALPVHMSAVLQSVNRLRFYRKSDISHRARDLLFRWSNMLEKNLSLKKSNGLKSANDLQDEMLLKQSISEVMGKESWDSRDANSEEAPRALCDSPNHRKLDTTQPLKLLTTSGDDSNKRRGVLSSHTRERRKVQMVEQPAQRSALRTSPVARSSPATQSRPLSADDIQKAKMRAQFMQSKYAKSNTSPEEKVKPESQNRCTPLHASLPPPVPKPSNHTEVEEQRKHNNSLSKRANPQETTQPNLEEPPWKRFKRIQIPWRTPAEIKIRETWAVADGANSKEVEVQKNRTRREREIFYRTKQEIPSVPREPWDREIDYDDTLTPAIPIEQLPDVEPLGNEITAPVASTSSGSMPEPDIELLAELLKNPELVFALTSGQAAGLSNNETVKLLDMIKAKGVGSLANVAGNGDNKVEVSLPSPTPSSDPVPNGSKPDFLRNPFSRQQNGTLQATGAALPTLLHQPVVQIPATTQAPAMMMMPEQWQASINPQMHHHNSLNTQHYNTHVRLNSNTNHLLVASSPSTWNGPSRSPPQSSYYQNNLNVNNYNSYGSPGRAVVPPAWGGVNRSEFESWSPDNSPSRRHEYLPGHYYHESSPNVRQGYRQPPSGYQDHSKQRRDYRR